MSLWYDIKNKVYSSGPMDNWYVKYLQNTCSTIVEKLTALYTQHFNGLIGKHNCNHIEYEEGVTLRQAFDAELANRQEEDVNIKTEMHSLFNDEQVARNTALSLKVDKESGKQLTTNDYTDAEKERLAKSAGKIVEGDAYSEIHRLPEGEIYVTPTSEVCREGSEIFNDYSGNRAQGICSHAEGKNTSATGDYAHAEGIFTKADGMCSHAEGENTCALGSWQHVEGLLNIEDTKRKYLHILGNGHYTTDSDNIERAVRSNAHTIDWDGNAWFSGDVTCGDAEKGLQAQITDLYNLRPTVITEATDTLNLNTIYDLGESQVLSLTVPNGTVGDWVKVDFLSGETPTVLSIEAENISDYILTPDANTAYSLYFDWGRLPSGSYGWRFAYNEYTKAVD